MAEEKDYKYKVRELTTGDIWRVAKILTELREKGLTEIFEAINLENAANGTEEEIVASIGTERVMDLVFFALRHAESVTREFMADLINMTPEEFDKTPIDTPIEVIEQLIKKPEARDFFTKALNLFKNFTNK